MKVFYTDDCIDHICAAAIVKYRFPECELCTDLYSDTIESNEKVFLLNYQPANIEELNEICELVCIDDLKNINFGMERIQKSNTLSELVWNYLFSESTPPIVNLLKQGSLKDILVFKYGSASHNPVADNTIFWEQLFGDWSSIYFNVVVKEGEKIYRYMTTEAAKYWNEYSFEIEIMGVKCVVLNKYDEIFQWVVKEKQCDVLILFLFKQNKWECTLYSNNHNINIIQIGHALFDEYKEGDNNKATFICAILPFA